MDSLSSCKSPQDAENIISKIAFDFGFTAYGYGSTCHCSGGKFNFGFQNLSKHGNWLKHYHDNNFKEYDPMLGYAKTNMRVTNFAREKHVETITNPTLLLKAIQVTEQAKAHMVINTVVTPIHTTSLDYGMMCFASDSKSIGDNNFVKEYEGELLLLGVTLHERMKHACIAEPVQTTLTDREKDCLLLALTGTKIKDIGSRLHISDHTVKHHLSSAKKKLNVSSYAHAAFLAFSQGLIQP